MEATKAWAFCYHMTLKAWVLGSPSSICTLSMAQPWENEVTHSSPDSSWNMDMMLPSFLGFWLSLSLEVI